MGYNPWGRKESDTPEASVPPSLWPGVPRGSPLAHTTQAGVKSRDVTLPTKVRLIKAMVFPVVILWM